MLCIPCLKLVSGYNVEYNEATSFNPRMFRGVMPPPIFLIAVSIVDIQSERNFM